LKTTYVTDKIQDVPRQPKIGRSYHLLSLSDLPWEIAEPITAAMGTSRNAAIEDLFNWFMRMPGAKLPERPPADVVKQAVAAWHERQDRIREVAYTLHCEACEVDEGPCITPSRKIPTQTIHKPRLEAAIEIVDKAAGEQPEN
jgi:hypothetical protein